MMTERAVWVVDGALAGSNSNEDLASVLVSEDCVTVFQTLMSQGSYVSGAREKTVFVGDIQARISTLEKELFNECDPLIPQAQWGDKEWAQEFRARDICNELNRLRQSQDR